jgi:competence protein ComGC
MPSLQIVGVCVHIQCRANSDDGNGMITMVMMAMMILLVMVIIVPEALRHVDSVCQNSCQTFDKLRDFHDPKHREENSTSYKVHISPVQLSGIVLGVLS